MDGGPATCDSDEEESASGSGNIASARLSQRSRFMSAGSRESGTTTHRVPQIAEDVNHCKYYLQGTCTTCSEGVESHGRLIFRPESVWGDRERRILRISEHTLRISAVRSHNKIISSWLICPTAAFPKVTDTDAVNYLQSATESCNIRHEVHRLIRTQWSVELESDNFLHFIRDFSENHVMEEIPKHKLLSFVDSEVPSTKECEVTYNHRSALYRWIEVCKLMTPGTVKIPELRFDDLLAELIRCAGEAAGITVLINMRESSRREFKVCGNTVTVQSNIEVSCSSEVIMNVITHTEQSCSPSDSGCCDMEAILGQISAKCLAVAGDSPFGNDSHKTVYNVSVIAKRVDDAWKLIVIPVQCHFSRNTLRTMEECPIPNPLRKSFILHDELVFEEDIYSLEVFKLLYRSFKAVLLIYKRCFQDT
ncbi:uncharacterized protein [Ptychodera flava]|uniref:uncharacterized protein n=1 Tax=Ptychodera flava TaxID=63121 RepID=UPI00396A0B5D